MTLAWERLINREGKLLKELKKVNAKIASAKSVWCYEKLRMQALQSVIAELKPGLAEDILGASWRAAAEELACLDAIVEELEL